MTQSTRVLWRHARIATLAPGKPWGWIERGALLTESGRVMWVGEESRLPADLDVVAEHDLGGACITPGLIDCHTHLVYGGHRAREFELRLQGASYQDIAASGGGIRATMRATREASEDQLFALAGERLRALMREGVTAVEIKSGYGLDSDTEARCLRVARRLQRALGITVRTTYLGAHAVPPEFDGRQQAYVDAVCAWMPQLQAQGLVDAVDAFCEGIAFTPEQVRQVFGTARGLGLPVKLHAEQLSDLGGAQLAAGFGALSCDHLEFLSPAGVAALAGSGTVAVLLPGAFYFLRETRLPPVDALRAAGVPIALATDHNPGTSPTLSLLLMLNMGCTLFRLTPEEALRGVTVHAARALGMDDEIGMLRVGMRADFCVWGVEHPNELAYYLGRNPLLHAVRAGSLAEQPCKP